tara:strand:+ start:299 stop:559 length:261 start_codon:yes stop_codon:yes gene_type:complete
MTENTVWQSSSLEAKWKDGRGDVRLAVVDFFGKKWIDLRILRDGKQHTRHGVRLSIEQATELLPRLIEALEQAKADAEKEERKDES